MHAGKEYDPYSNLEQKLFARKAIDMGVDLIIGHHPHAVQEIEFYKGKTIFYSLGNAFFDQDWTFITMRGLSVIVHTRWNEEQKKNEIHHFSLVLVKQANEAHFFVPSYHKLELDLEEYRHKEDAQNASKHASEELFKEIGLKADYYKPLHDEFEACLEANGTSAGIKCNSLVANRFLHLNV